MSIKRCKLSKKNQRKLVEFFVLEVTARSAGDIPDETLHGHYYGIITKDFPIGAGE